MPYDYIEEYQKQDDETIWEFRDKDAQSKIDTSLTETDYANPLSLETMSAQLAKNTKVKIEPIQDLHGYDKPWVGGAGKNKLPMTVERIKALNTGGTWSGNEYTYNGMKFTLLVDSDNNLIGIKANGTFNPGGTFVLYTGSFTTGSYHIRNLCSATISGGEHTLQATADGASTSIYVGTNGGSDITISATVYIRMAFAANLTLNNVTFTPLLVRQSVTDYTFEPYSNICPISGHDQIDILGCGKNLIRYPYPMQGSSIAKSGTTSGITWYILDDNSVFLEGNKTATANVRLNVYSTISSSISSKQDFIPYIGKEVILSGCASGGSVNTYFLNFQGFVKDGIGIQNFGTDQNIVISDITDFNTIQIVVAVQSGYTIPSDGLLFKPMIRLASITDDTYSPYQSSNDLSIDLPSTVYGGVLDLESGELVVDYGIVDLGDLSWVYHSAFGVMYSTSLDGSKKNGIDNFITSCYELDTKSEWTIIKDKSCCGNSANAILYFKDSTYNDASVFKTAVTGQTICYELSTPTTIQLTPHQLSLLKSQNNLTTSQYTQIKVIYRNGMFATLEPATDLTAGLMSAMDKLKLDSITDDATKTESSTTNGNIKIDSVETVVYDDSEIKGELANLGLSVVDGKLCQTYNT